MTEKQQKVRKYQAKFEEAKAFLENKYEKEFSSLLVTALLGHYFETEDVDTFLIFHDNICDLDFNKILDNEVSFLVGTFDFDSTELDFLYSDRLEKAKVKENGLIWIIHNNDCDPNPSKPHAHEYILNVKLHLKTGELYRKDKIVGKLSKKEFKRVKIKILEKGIKLPA